MGLKSGKERNKSLINTSLNDSEASLTPNKALFSVKLAVESSRIDGAINNN
jgi:hypothetical protein